MHVLIPLTAALVPLIMSPGLLFHFDITPKVVLLLLAVSAILVKPAVLRESFTNLLNTSYGRWFSAILLLELISFGVSTFFSTDRWLSVDGSEWRRLGLYTFAALVVFVAVAAGWLRSKSNMVLLLRACAITTIPIAAYAITQYFGLDPFLPSSAYQAGEGPFTIVRPPATLGHANYFGCFLVFAVFASLAFLHAAARPSDRAISIAAAWLAAAALVLSGTRAGLAGAAAGLITLLIVNRAAVRRGHLIAGLVVLSVTTAFIISPAGAMLRARIYWSNEDRLGGARLLLWRDSMRMIAARPLFGFGPETFIREFPLFQSPELARAYPDFFHESPHNVLLDAAASQGVIGAVLLATLWCVGTIAGVLAIRRGHPLAAPLLAGNVGLFVSHQFIVFVPATALVFLLSQAILVASLRATDALVLPQTRSWRWSLASVGTVVAVTFVVYAVRLSSADHSLEIARRDIAAGNIEGAIQAHGRVKQIEPRGGTSELYYSREMASAAARNTSPEQQAQLWKQALEAGARCVAACEQRANAWYSLATLLAAQGDTRGVERALRNASAWAPNWFKPHWTLALLLNMAGRQQEAMTEAVTAVDRNGGKNPEVLATWLTLANAARRQ